MSGVHDPHRPENRGASDAESIGTILSRVMRDVNPGPRRRKSGVQRAWERAAGTELAVETRPVTLRRGVLTVEVRASALLHELDGFRRKELLDRLLEEDATGRITGLRFRPGVF